MSTIVISIQMAIKFDQLPLHIQLQILKNLHFKDFTKFRLCSGSAFQGSEFLTKKLPLKIYKWDVTGVNESSVNIWAHNVPVNDDLFNAPVKINCVWLVIKTNLTNHLCEYLIRCFEKSFSASGIDCMADVICSPEMFNKLIQVSKAKKVSNEHSFLDMTSPYFQQPAVQKLKCLLGAMSIKDTDLVKLKASDLDNTFLMSAQNSFVTSVGINNALKQWQSGERKIRKWELLGRFPTSDDSRLLDEVFFANIWNSEIHWETKLVQVPHCKLYDLVKNGESARVFGLTRSSDEDVLIVLVFSQQLTIQKVESFDCWIEKQIYKQYRS